MNGQSETLQTTGGTEAETADRATWKGLAAAGALVGALAASSCCILPLALFAVGVGGAWMANLTALAPYQPLFVIVTLGFLGLGYWLSYRASRARCSTGAACARPMPNRLVKVALWAAAALITAALAFPYVAPAMLGI